MEDPLSQLHDRPHRYLLESDSSDEEGQGIYGTNESGPSTIPKPKIQTSQEYTVDDVDITGGSWDSYEEIILGVEQSGRYLVRRLGVKGDADVTVNVGGRTMGSGWGIGRRLLLIMGEGEQETLHILAHALLANSGTRPWSVHCGERACVPSADTRSRMIVSTYLPSMYIPDRALSLPTAPIRHVTIHGAQIIDKTVDGAEPLSSPNYVTGLAAALLSNVRSSPVSPGILLSLPHVHVLIRN